MGERMDIDLKDIGEHKIVMISGNLDIFTGKKKLKEILTDIIAGDNQSLVIDLKNVDFIDSTGIGLLIKAYKDMTSRKGKFALVNVSNDFLKVLKISTLDKILTIYKSYDELM